MLALIVSYLLVFYLLVPAVLFRLPARSILKKFQRTRTEEITFAVSVTLLPLVLAGIVLAVVWQGTPHYAEWADYKEILAASYSEEVFRATQNQFWNAASRVFFGQVRLLLLVWVFCYLEGRVFLALVRSYGRLRANPALGWIATRLLSSVSEWYLLLTPANFPPAPKRRVAVDVLTEEDHLYQGFIGDYFLDTDGKLSGLLLVAARRFDRQRYLALRSIEPSTKPEAFWREIPGQVLYLPQEKILSVNVRYPLEEPGAAGTATAAAVTDELAQAGIELLVRPEETDESE